MASTPGISAFSPGGFTPTTVGYTPPAGGFTMPPGLLSALGAATAPAAASGRGGSPAGQNYGPFTGPNPAAQDFGLQSPLNPLLISDLLNMGAGPFLSPPAGMGQPGYPSQPGPTKVMSAPVGPAVSGVLARAPIPQSGGKGMVG
jgi:hypothetical protein